MAVCPSTRNRVRENFMLSESAEFGNAPLLYGRDFLYDLYWAARDRADSAGGHSYETFIWWEEARFPDGTVVSGRGRGSIGSQLGFASATAASAGITVLDDPTTSLAKTAVSVQFPSRTVLIIDNDNDQSISASIGRPDGVNNWPEQWNNHGENGVNAAFCDGSARWVPRRDLMKTFMDGYETPPTNFAQVSEYRQTSTTYQGVTIPWYYVP